MARNTLAPLVGLANADTIPKLRRTTHLPRTSEHRPTPQMNSAALSTPAGIEHSIKLPKAFATGADHS